MIKIIVLKNTYFRAWHFSLVLFLFFLSKLLLLTVFKTRAISNHMCRLMMANFMLGQILWQTDRQMDSAQLDLVLIIPVKFGWNCTCSLWGVVRTSFCVSGNTQKKKTFLSKGHNSAKNHSTRKPLQYAQGFELQINPVKFLWNCISGIREVVRTNFKMKNY
jgi:hypothetical protein